MDFITLLLLAFGLCFDSFAVSLSCGIIGGKLRFSRWLRFAVILGVMQGVMPVIGWFLAIRFSTLIGEWDHWVAFGLLLFLGCKMIWSAIFDGEKDNAVPCDVFALKRSLLMGFATSIDALASGVAIAFLPLKIISGSGVGVNILMVFLVVTLITIMASLLGLFLGNRSSGKLGSRAEIVGGVILITIGVKVLFEHLLC